MCLWAMVGVTSEGIIGYVETQFCSNEPIKALEDKVNHNDLIMLVCRRNPGEFHRLITRRHTECRSLKLDRRQT